MKIDASKIVLFLILAAALVGYASVSNKMSGSQHQCRTEELKQKLPSTPKAPKEEATLDAGRVVQLHTNKGLMELVLLEKDCPKTTKRIADLVSKKAYDGVKFGRVEKNDLIQTDSAKIKVKPMECEVRRGMTHGKWSVGMARGPGYDTNTSEFYIALEPHPAHDMEFTNFGRLINGMDVAMRIEAGDVIRTASLRELTKKDQDRYWQVLKNESDRKVN